MSNISKNLYLDVLNSNDVLETIRKQKTNIDFELDEADRVCTECVNKFSGECKTCKNDAKIKELLKLLEEVVTLKGEFEK